MRLHAAQIGRSLHGIFACLRGGTACLRLGNPSSCEHAAQAEKRMTSQAKHKLNAGCPHKPRLGDIWSCGLRGGSFLEQITHTQALPHRLRIYLGEEAAHQCSGSADGQVGLCICGEFDMGVPACQSQRHAAAFRLCPALSPDPLPLPQRRSNLEFQRALRSLHRSEIRQ